MLVKIIQQIIISIIIIALLQYLYFYCKEQCSNPIEKHIKEDLQKKYEEMYSVLQKERGEKPIQNETENKEATQPINMDSMKKELLDYINTLE